MPGKRQKQIKEDSKTFELIKQQGLDKDIRSESNSSDSSVDNSVKVDLTPQKSKNSATVQIETNKSNDSKKKKVQDKKRKRSSTSSSSSSSSASSASENSWKTSSTQSSSSSGSWPSSIFGSMASSSEDSTGESESSIKHDNSFQNSEREKKIKKTKREKKLKKSQKRKEAPLLHKEKTGDPQKKEDEELGEDPVEMTMQTNTEVKNPKVDKPKSLKRTKAEELGSVDKDTPTGKEVEIGESLIPSKKQKKDPKQSSKAVKPSAAAAAATKRKYPKKTPVKKDIEKEKSELSVESHTVWDHADRYFNQWYQLRKNFESNFDQALEKEKTDKEKKPLSKSSKSKIDLRLKKSSSKNQKSSFVPKKPTVLELN